MIGAPRWAGPADGEVVEGTAAVGRVDDHRRVRRGQPRPRRLRRRGHRRATTPRCACGWRPSATTPRSRASSGSWRRRRLELARAAARRSRGRVAVLVRARCRPVITAIVWTLAGSPDDAVIRTITVLVIACPHASAWRSRSSSRSRPSARRAAACSITDRLALETMRTVGAVLFDKTGTLTKGEPAVTRRRRGLRGSTPTSSWRSRPRRSRTPSTRSPRRSSRMPRRRLSSRPRRTSRVGRDRRARHGREAHRAGRRSRTARSRGAGVARGIPPAGPSADRRCCTCSSIGQVAGAIALADELRRNPREAVDALHALGVQVVMITGDAEPVARTVAASLGIDRVFAGVAPRTRPRRCRSCRPRACRSAMVGDGVNDAPALAQAVSASPSARHGCRDRVGRRHPRVIRPAFGALGHRAVSRELPQDVAEPWWAPDTT